MTQNTIRIDSQAEYVIRVVGYLDENWSDRFNGMAILPRETSGPKPETTLIGPLVDQAALFGVLNALYDMRLPLISVECLSVETDPERPNAPQKNQLNYQKG